MEFIRFSRHSGSGGNDFIMRKPFFFLSPPPLPVYRPFSFIHSFSLSLPFRNIDIYKYIFIYIIYIYIERERRKKREILVAFPLDETKLNAHSLLSALPGPFYRY